jgi:hypothetical protein
MQIRVLSLWFRIQFRAAHGQAQLETLNYTVSTNIVAV